MKRYVCLGVLLLFAAGFSPIGDKIKNPKKIACKETCKTAVEECKKKASENKGKTEEEAALAACEAAYNECVEKCEKK